MSNQAFSAATIKCIENELKDVKTEVKLQKEAHETATLKKDEEIERVNKLLQEHAVGRTRWTVS